jgi:hypothetical protein
MSLQEYKMASLRDKHVEAQALAQVLSEVTLVEEKKEKVEKKIKGRRLNK